MNDNYLVSSELFPSSDEIPGDKYEIPPISIIDYDEFVNREGLDFFPLFEAKDNIFGEIPLYVWNTPSARAFLQQLAFVYDVKRNPSLSYTPIRVEKEDSFFVLEWLFQDKRFSFFFSDDEENKYSIICYNATENTFVNSVKTMPKERYKEIAEEIISYLT